MSDKNQTIALLGEMKTKEAKANAQLFPGQLITLNASKEAIAQTNKIQPRIAVAVENDMIGKGITDAYEATERLYYKVPVRGDVVNLRVATASAAIVYGDLLAVGTAGKVIKHGANFATETVVGYALEAVTNVSGSDVFIAVEIQ